MTTTNITNFRKNAFDYVEQTIKYNQPINITTKDGNAVLLSEEDYSGIMETLYLVSAPGMREKIMDGIATSLEDCVDVPKLKSAHLDEKAKALIEIIRVDPFQNPPPYEKLVGDLNGAYSRRINIQHRLVYQVYEKEQTVKILSLWTHYER